jgi:hypothetical protein
MATGRASKKNEGKVNKLNYCTLLSPSAHSPIKYKVSELFAKSCDYVLRGSGTKNVIFFNRPNFLSECSKLLYKVSLRYPESLVKKIVQNPPIGYVKIAVGFFGGKSCCILLVFLLV